MDKEKLNDSYEVNKEKIIDVAKGLVPQVVVFQAMNNEHYPRCCREATSLSGILIKKETGINGIKMCRGSVTTVSENKICRFHAWLEYGDLIIDPMDFQFNTIDEDDLPMTEETTIPEDLSSLEGLSQDQMNDVFMKTWLSNAEKRYLEDPNEKEKYFLHLNELLKAEKIDPVDYYREIRRCFGLKTFYDKKDKDRVYEAEHIEPVILNNTVRKARRAVKGKW